LIIKNNIQIFLNKKLLNYDNRLIINIKKNYVEY
jgi:hypothetical protein